MTQSRTDMLSNEYRKAARRHSMFSRIHKKIFAASIVLFCFAILGLRANAEVSVDDGWGPDGLPQAHYEFDPYVWLPATSAKIKLGNGANINISQGVPSPSDLVSTLNGAFMGFGLARYGSISAELDLNWVSGSESKNLGPSMLTSGRSLKLDLSFFRIAPGFGYEIYKGNLGSLPTTFDARAGFSFAEPSATLTFTRTNLAGVTNQFSAGETGGFVQPWLGGRAAFYPWKDWRFSVDGDVQGLGVNGGSWGWQLGAYVTWSANNWLNVIAGYRALNTDRVAGSSAVFRSLDITEFGPVVAVGFSF